MPIKPIIVAAGCVSLQKLVLRGAYAPDFKHVQDYLSEWMSVSFQPPNLSIVFYEIDAIFHLPEIVQWWPQWNNQILAGRTAHFRIYFTKCNPLDVSSTSPEFQLDFGQTATYPFVKASNFGLFGFGNDLLLLANSAGNGKAVHKASVMAYGNFSFCMSNLCCVSGLSFVTDFTTTKCGLLSGHLEQLSIACPNVEQLSLRGNRSCLESLQGLRNIVDHCHKLQAVNLEDVHATKIQNCMYLWKVLSEIKMLNCLRIEMCTMKGFIGIDASSQHSFVHLAVKFECLKQLELMHNYHSQPICVPYGDELQHAYPVLLSHFPSLVCCFAWTETPTVIMDLSQNVSI